MPGLEVSSKLKQGYKQNRQEIKKAKMVIFLHYAFVSELVSFNME
jgi:hypothetical protein